MHQPTAVAFDGYYFTLKPNIMNHFKNTALKSVATLLCILSLTFISETASAQSADDMPLKQAEVMPTFKGGDDAMMKYLSESIQYPADAKEKGEQGKVYVGFVIDEKGNVTDAVVKRGVSATLNAEALRVVNAMPQWTPGEQDGKKVKVEYVVPIYFKLK
ncbi:MAG: energy transducer TonB [Bacteroidetes bacterium]|nr:energy transducer TonB [Bacteroidota bacterium]MBP7398020.1 energy transducer TonB [Chitinophagales bacterium]MBK8680984.1 energy transducer TonB [Bacteroidota bacterium]MBP8753614.1 energy transducer TonB [Chitinophagales bacterium]MBP9188375.1 energy transducer TonB [Chitinophagales bacterium]